MVIRPATPTNAERAKWWRTSRPTRVELRNWKLQVAIDMLTEDGLPIDIAAEDDPDEHMLVPSQVLPAAAFDGTARKLPARTIEAQVPRNALWYGTDAWTCIFASRMAGAADKATAFDVRETLRRGELPVGQTINCENYATYGLLSTYSGYGLHATTRTKPQNT